MDAPHEAFPLPEGCDEGYVVANGVRLHYVAAGSGPLAILLHGFPEFWYVWSQESGSSSSRPLRCSRYRWSPRTQRRRRRARRA
jgi:pimeloyl-ACP methyl ester carboxylesterase